GGGGTIPDGLNNKANHDAIVKGLEKTLPKAAQMGVPNLITFFGNRKGMPDQEGLDNCVVGLNRIKPMAEAAGVTVTIEVLNSKVDHKDYLGDRSYARWRGSWPAWRPGSPSPSSAARERPRRR